MVGQQTDQANAGDLSRPRAPMSTRNKVIVILVTAIVVIIVISIIPPPPRPPVTHELSVTLSPSSIEVPAGDDVNLVAVVLWDGEELVEGTVTSRWSLFPAGLGDIVRDDERTATFRAGSVPHYVSISCEVTYFYDGSRFHADSTLNLTIGCAVIEYVVVYPPVRTMLSNSSQVFHARAFDTLDIEMNNVTFAWSVLNMSAGDYNLSSAVGSEVNFTGLDLGLAELNVTAMIENRSAIGAAVVAVVPSIPDRTVNYSWHDMFNVPNGEWWNVRWNVSGLDQPLTDSYPYLYRWYGPQEGSSRTYSSMMMDITARNMYEISMNEWPQFLPLFGNWRGGNAQIDWYMQYLTSEEAKRYPAFVASQYDGWISVLNGTVRLDRDAAMSVMGMARVDFDDFASWWSFSEDEFIQAYFDWLRYEGNARLDIHNTYAYPFTLLYLDISAEKVGSEVVLTYDIVSWGMDVLMASWLREAFMPAEWYYEDFSLHAAIAPEWADLDIETAVEYALQAHETAEEGLPCWRWEPRLGDVIPSSPEHPISDFDPYARLSEWIIVPFPGSDLFGWGIDYDYTPAAFNLSEGERLSFEWPSGDQMFLVHGGDFYNTTQLFAPMEVRYAEPMWGDMPDNQYAMDNSSRTITYIGPFDMWNWSRTQTEHQRLADEWDRVGLLPYGIPSIEFAMALGPPSLWFDVSGPAVPLDVGEPYEFSVTVMAISDGPYPFYNGTVRFFTSDATAVLPGDYTFNSTVDNGTHNFTVTFNSYGYFNLTIVDVNNRLFFGGLALIPVGYYPPVLSKLVLPARTAERIASSSS